MRTPQFHVVREAVMREPDAGRYVHVKPRQLPPNLASIHRSPGLGEGSSVGRAVGVS
jgi:hypothetical protein